MSEYVSDVQTGHMQKMTVHQNVTAFKETHVSTQGNISENIFKNVQSTIPFSQYNLSYIGGAMHVEIFTVAIHVPKLKPYKGELAFWRE